MDADKKALEGFRRLPREDQDRIRREGMQIGNRVANHVVQVLIGPRGNKADPANINHASAVTILTGKQLAIATADHVLKAYWERSAADPGIGF